MQEPEDKVVAKIKPGSGFGELGFLSAKGRTKGAKTGPAGAHVLYVNYELYVQLFMRQLQKKMQEKIEMLGRIQLFDHLPQLTTMALAQSVRESFYHAGKVMHVQLTDSSAGIAVGDDDAQLFMIVEGSADLVVSQTRDGNLALPAGGILLSSMRQGHIFGDVSALSPWAPQTAHLTLRVRSSTEVKLLTISVEEAFHLLPSERSKAIRKLATEKAGWQQQRLAVLVQGYGPKRQAGVAQAWASPEAQGEDVASLLSTTRPKLASARSARRREVDPFESIDLCGADVYKPKQGDGEVCASRQRLTLHPTVEHIGGAAAYRPRHMALEKRLAAQLAKRQPNGAATLLSFRPEEEQCNSSQGALSRIGDVHTGGSWQDERSFGARSPLGEAAIFVGVSLTGDANADRHL
ncbi:MAG: hypothetical protein SGPRY_002516 [Prymnesium sp.]